MSKLKVHELAKELGVESKEVIRRLGKMGSSVTSHMNTVDDDHANKLRDIMRPKMVIDEKSNKVPVAKSKASQIDKNGPKAQDIESKVNDQKMTKTTQINNSNNNDNYVNKTDFESEKETKKVEKKEQVINNINTSEENSEIKKNITVANDNENASANNRQNQDSHNNGPQGQESQDNKPQGQGYQGNRPQGQGYQGNRPQGQGYQGNKPQGQGYQGNRPQGQGYQGNKPQGQGYQGNKPQGQGYQGNRQQGQGYQGNRPQGQGYQGDRPQGQGYQGNRPQGQGYQGNKPQGQGYQGNRQQGQGYQGNRPQGQGYQGNRPQGQGYQDNRPQGQGYQGNRPQGQGYQGDRPQGQGYQGNRPQGQGYQGDRPQGQGYQGNRPQGQGYQGNRPQGQGYQGNRPQGQGYQGDRPQGQGYQGDRPQGQGYQGNRPQGQGYQGDRPQGQGYQGNRPQGQGYQGNRPGGYDKDKDDNYQNKRFGQPKQEKPASDTPLMPEKRDARRFETSQKKASTKNPYAAKKNKNNENHRAFHNNRRKPIRKAPKEIIPPVTPKNVIIGDIVMVSELASAMAKTAADVIMKLMAMGIMATVNQEIDSDTAILVAEEFGVTAEVRVDKTMDLLEDDNDDSDNLVSRPPVVTVMGHVDHGKTSLLDAIRQTNVISSEAGGITQHIGAYQVEISGQKITFLDTPGHEAFTSMRARGAQVTDIAILVVAADDGVMPQTIEAINHAKAAKVPIIVAINKIDKEGADVSKIKQNLTEYGLVSEEWGGDTIMVSVSAKNNEGITDLLEMILLVSEVAELKSNPNRNARGTIIEAQLDKGRGAVATVLVEKGTLKIGDILVAGTVSARVRAMIDDTGRRIKQAGPSMPVEILGFSDVPPPGAIFVAVDDEKDAKYIASHNNQAKRSKEMSKSAKVSLDDLFKQISEGQIKDLNIVVKADVQGSIEALCQSISNLATDEVRVNIIHSGVGAIIESDVMLAAASNALIIGFNVRPDANTKRAAENEDIEIRTYRVIYDALNDIKDAMSGLLDPEYKEEVIGHIEIRQVIKVPKVGLIAGCYIQDGKVIRQAQLRLLRDGIVIHEGEIQSLRRFKDDVKEVQTGYECGIGIANFNDVKIGDNMEIFIMKETKREL